MYVRPWPRTKAGVEIKESISVPAHVSTPEPKPRYGMRQKIYLMFFWCLKEIVCVKCTENNSYFCHVTTCLHHCHIIVSFWYMRSVISLNEQFCFLQTRQWFSKKKIIPGKLLAAILHFPICPFHPASPEEERGCRGKKRSCLWTTQWG